MTNAGGAVALAMSGLTVEQLGYLRDATNGNVRCPHPTLFLLTLPRVAGCRLCGAVICQAQEQ